MLGYDLTKASYWLSQTIPSLISMKFDPGASKNMLDAFIKDLVEELGKATEVTPPSADGLNEWLQVRAKERQRRQSAATVRKLWQQGVK